MPRLSPVQMVRSAELVMGKCQLDRRAMAEFAHNSATFGVLRLLASFGVKLLTRVAFGRVRLSVLCHDGCTALLDGRPGSAVCWTRWRPTIGIRRELRRSSCGVPVCGSPRSSSSNGGISTTQSDPATLLVRKSKSRRVRTVRLHQDYGAVSSRTGRRTGRLGTRWCRSHDEDGVEAHWRWHRVG